MNKYIFIALLVIFALGFFALSKFPKKSDLTTKNDEVMTNTNLSSTPVSPIEKDATASGMTKPSSLEIKEVKLGSGVAAKVGDKLKVNYTGKFADGTIFDTSKKEGRSPFIFTLGAGEVIKGWDQGLLNMQVGGTRVLTIPPELAYGESGSGPIPGNSTLTFEVELLEIVK